MNLEADLIDARNELADLRAALEAAERERNRFQGALKEAHIWQDELEAERDALKEQVEAAERDSEHWSALHSDGQSVIVSLKAERDALKERAEAAEQQAQLWEQSATIRLNAADALKERAEELAGWLKLIAAIEREYPQTDCDDCQWDSGPFCLPCDKHDVGKLADAALARLDQQETE